MRGFAFSQVDVFGSRPYRGNPVAVVHDADALSEGQMAEFARWTNLSETTFLLHAQHPDADYRLRIFTPGGELPFAGHPTLGSCRAWLAAGGMPRRTGHIVQECGAGLVPLRAEGGALAFLAPPRLRTGPLAPGLLAEILQACSLQESEIMAHEWVDNGPGWCAVLLESAERVLSLAPDFVRLGDIALGVVGPYPPGGGAEFEVRAFVPSLGVAEDPVTGSLNASIAQWLIGAGLAPERYRSSQGARVGRAGRVDIEQINGDVWVGGATDLLIRGEVSFEVVDADAGAGN